ncbi:MULTISPECIES: glycosyl hydrolase family 18 protein [unclassified Pseudoalteromonas]|uniref:glycosyl hydrolase family 18 protein n=1 Tax=unclassified Pseudoalteromonas TaxID=194690 RepID=UPI001F361C38|nr:MULTISPECIES: glycosyl hydrolase family 18 protein [unclassified Pseudoalteromonas]MCF2826116.1 glycosyl hydrolase family 18 protein [Pseudoalteromonas sp. OF5H-5]MCF2832528.1 glycosyl hydrolase family 18 protein [Pseudoalteromonas sp. DL2-H6]MCF2924935.1 glycosyl hydrolase family 18 protein [Pseudoalteromonas sp. DL2-H1]
MKQHVKTLKLSQMASILGAIFCANSYAYNCDGLPEWSQNSAYNGGAQVQKSQQAFEAKWWTQADPVTHSGQWDDWKKLGDCDSVVTNTPPTVQSLLPADGSAFKENDSVAISVNATDSDGQVAQVEFFVDGTSVGIDTTATGDNFSFNWSATAGTHAISVVATDDKQAVSNTLITNIIVNTAGNQLPTANLSLGGGNNLVINQPVDIVLDGSDPDGSIAKLTLLINDQVAFESATAPAQHTWTPTQLGAVTLKLIVEDNTGATAESILNANVVETPPVVNNCVPHGLYQTPNTSPNYCDIYDENGREKMGTDHPRRVIGYFTSWRTGKNGQPSYLVDDIPWDKITHINYAFAHVDANNKVSIGNPTAPNNAATNMTWPGVAGAEMDPSLPYTGHFNLLNKFKKQHPDVKTLISVGGWAETGGYFDETGKRVASGGFYTMTTNADGSVNHAGIDAFVASSVEFIRKYNFDGVDIDYEYPSSMNDSGHPDDFAISNPRRAALNASYQVLMKKLREALDQAGQQDNTHYLLTIASPSSGYLLRGMETFQVTKYLDYVNIMSYDLHGAWNQHVGHNASLFDTGEDSELKQWNVYGTKEFEGIGYLNTDWAVKYFRGSVSAGRINIGIPYYTRGFRDVTGGTNGLWGQAALPNQADCPPGTGSGEKNKCGNGAVGIDNLWHDKNDVGLEVPAGSNPLWHVKNLQNGVLGSYLGDYGLDPVNNPAHQISGTYARHYDSVAVAPWLWNATKNVFLSIEDEESMAAKVDYVINQELGGIMFWELAGDFDYDVSKNEYFMGSSLTSLAYNKFNQSGTPYSVKQGNKTFVKPASAVDVTFVAKDFPAGDANYPIAPTFAFTNNSAIDLSGAKISFDVPVATSAIFKSNWNAQEKLGMAVDVNGSNAAGNNIGGFENEFHRFSITLVNEWGGTPKSFAPGETINAQVMYYMPISGPVNFVVEKDGNRYAFTSEYNDLPIATPGTGPTDPVTSCKGTPISQIVVYPNLPQGTHAAQGDLIVEGNAVYEAKWWSNKQPSVSSDYTKVCNL